MNSCIHYIISVPFADVLSENIFVGLYGPVFPLMLDEVIEKWNKEFYAE